MRYLGGKARVAREVSELMKEANKDTKLPYFEPFLGGGNMLVRMADRSDVPCFATDVNPNVVVLFQAYKRGWVPPQVVSKSEFLACKRDVKEMGICTAYHSFVGYGCAFSGVWYGSYAAPRFTVGGKEVPVSRESYNFFHKNDRALKHTTYLDAASYETFQPRGMLIYCDPPYLGTSGYNRTPVRRFESFDTERFWQTMREWSRSNLVFVSESTDPPGDDWEIVWTKDIACSTRGAGDHNINRHGTQRRRTENLYTLSRSKPPTLPSSFALHDENSAA